MKYYSREPDAFFGGVAGMTLEQIGAYTLIIDRLYALDGLLADDDMFVARTFHIDIRQWKRVKHELMELGKIRVTTDGMLDANGVRSRRLLANIRSTSAKHAADVRWTNYRKAKENNEAVMRRGNASYNNKYKSSTNLEVQRDESCGQEVAEKDDDNFGAVPVKPKKPAIPVTDELAANIKRKWFG